MLRAVNGNPVAYLHIVGFFITDGGNDQTAADIHLLSHFEATDAQRPHPYRIVRKMFCQPFEYFQSDLLKSIPFGFPLIVMLP